MDEFFIEKVREHPVLYDHGCRDYRDQHIRRTAWEEVGKELNITGPAAKERWEKLRRCFSNARNRRMEETKSGMATKKKTSWKYEQQMAFIIPYLESRKTQSNLLTEQEDLSEESDVEENTPNEPELGPECGQGSQEIDDDAVLNDTATTEQRMNAMKMLRNKKQKRLSDTPAQQMVQILKESSELRKRQYEEKSITRPLQTSKSSVLDNLDDTDMFFLSMARMTKQLPKIEQAQIKLSLSNSVLSAEIRCNQTFTSSTYSSNQRQSFQHYPQNHLTSVQSATSPSNYSSIGDENSTTYEDSRRPTLLDMMSLSNEQYQ